MIDFCNYKWTTEMSNGRIIHREQPWMWYDGDCICVFNDKDTAYMICENKPTEIHHWDEKTYNPTVACGLLRSVDDFGYGRFSAEIQLPRGKNLWPAFWLVGEGEPWPQCGEIDIMEAWTNQFNGYYRCGTPQPPYIFPTWDTTTNIHWEEEGVHGYAGSRRLPLLFSLKRPAHNLVRYEVEWRPNTITFYMNGKRVRCYGWDVARHLLDKKMHVIFDLWTTCKDFTCLTPMKIRNYVYTPIDML